MSSITEAPTPTWATERTVSRWGEIEWGRRVATLHGAALISDDDVAVEVRQSPNCDDAPTDKAVVSTTAGIHTFDLMAEDARKLAAALLEAAAVAEAAQG